MKYIFAFFSKMYRKYCLRDNFWRSKFLKCTFANTLISRLFFAKFLYFHIFPFFFHILECEAFQIFCPLLNFQALEMFPAFPAFPVFLGKKEEKLEKKLLDENGPINTHLRYDNPAKRPRALVPFLIVANVACSYCLQQIITTCIGPYRLAQQTQALQDGRFTPYDHVFTLCQQLHTEPVEMLTIWLVSPRNRPRNRPRDFRFRFRFFSVSLKKRPSHFLLSVYNPACTTG